ncbi:MAG: hypothetical protein QW714_00215 [Nanopusillaceae archaeon]
MGKIEYTKVKYWYSKDWVSNMIIEDCQSREIMAVMKDSSVRRPIYIETYGDLLSFVEKGAISFHRSIEKFSDVGTFENLKSYDIIIDLDISSEVLRFEDKIYAVSIFAKEMIDFLFEFGFKESEIGIKYSGNHGIHLKLSIDGLEDTKIFGVSLLDGFPIFSKNIVEFLSVIAQQIKANIKEKPVNYVEIDKQVATKRHMIRAVLSINEKLPGVSYPLSYDDLLKLPEEYKKYSFKNISNLDLPSGEWINIKPSKTIIDLIRVSTLWKLIEEATKRYIRSEEYKIAIKKYKKDKEYKKEIPPDLEESYLFPPCIRNILSGVEDGRKRSVFILINFLANIGWSFDKIYQKLLDWNSKNKEELREHYIEYQLDWHKRVYSQNKKYLPPNCENVNYYKDIVTVNGAACKPDDICPLIKNPLTYYLKKLKIYKSEEKVVDEKDLL